MAEQTNRNRDESEMDKNQTGQQRDRQSQTGTPGSKAPQSQPAQKRGDMQKDSESQRSK